jgi:hypothetical protein
MCYFIACSFGKLELFGGHPPVRPAKPDLPAGRHWRLRQLRSTELNFRTARRSPDRANGRPFQKASNRSLLNSRGELPPLAAALPALAPSGLARTSPRALEAAASGAR